MSKIAVVTGGAKGIGEQICRLLHSYGVKVIILDIDVEKGEALAKILPGSIFQNADISKLEIWQNLSRQFEQIDYLFLNAGTPEQPIKNLQDVLEKDPDLIAAMSTVHKTMEVNFYQVVYAVGTIVPLMEKQGGGKIIATSSIHVFLPSPKGPVYCATKFAAFGYMQAIKDQLNQKNIQTYDICPGTVGTDMCGEDWEKLPYQFIDPKIVAEAAVEAALQDKPSQTITVLLGRNPVVQEQKEVFVKFEGDLLPPKIES